MNFFKFNLNIASFLFLLTMFLFSSNLKEGFRTVTIFTTTTQQTTALYMSTKKGNSKRLTFIKDNIDDIQIQIAQGEGEHLDTLAHLYAIEDVAMWKNDLQENYSKIFAMNHVPQTAQLTKYLKGRK